MQHMVLSTTVHGGQSVHSLWRIFTGLRSERAKKAYNLIRTAEHFTGFSAMCVTSHVTV